MSITRIASVFVEVINGEPDPNARNCWLVVARRIAEDGAQVIEIVDEIGTRVYGLTPEGARVLATALSQAAAGTRGRT